MKKIYIIILIVCAFVYARQFETPVRFAIIGDRTGNAQAGVYEQIVSEVQALKPDFVLTVGDMIEGPARDTIEISERWQEYKSLISALSIPVYYTPGNNDIWDDASHLFYQRYAGKPYYSFDIKGVHFISLDVSRYESSTEIDRRQLQWLINDLNKNKRARHTIVFYHKPFWFDEILEDKPDTLHSIFRKFGADAVFNGHLHNYFSEKIDDILYTAVGSSGGGAEPGLTGIQFHYTWVTIDKNGITVTPIKKNSVFTQDEVTARQVKIVDKISLSGISFENAVRINQHMKLADSLIYLRITNISDYVLDDTIRWQSQDNWAVMPKTLPVTLPAKESCDAVFTLKNKGEPYPLPILEVNFPYAQDKEYKLEKPLPISRAVLCNKALNPVIDGKINEPFWQNPVNKLYAPDGSQIKVDSTWFYYAYDTDNLYLAARCREQKMNQLAVRVFECDGAVYAEDCVGYFLSPSRDTIYQIYFNPNGVVFDQKIYNNGNYADRAWNGAYEVKTDKGDDFWTIEARIPLEQFGFKAESGQEWGINFRRKQKRLNSAADFQVPIQYDPETYGALIMQ